MKTCVWRQCPYLVSDGRGTLPHHAVFSTLTTNQSSEDACRTRLFVFDWTLGVSIRISALWRRWLCVCVCVYIYAESPLSQHITTQSERNRLDRTSLGECVEFRRRWTCCVKSPAPNLNGRRLLWFLTFSNCIFILNSIGRSTMTHGSGAEMVPEVSAAAGFVCRLLRGRGRLSDAQLQVFRDCLAQALSGMENTAYLQY